MVIGKCWCVGHNATDIRNRPLTLRKQDKKTGKGLAEATGNTIPVMLGNDCSGLALPFDSTLTAAIIGGSSTIIKWT